jgi:hypothetical protein
MKVNGIVASDVSIIPDKGVGFQVMVMDLGITLGCFVPQDKLNGEGKLKMGDNVIADMRRPYASGRDVKFNIESVKLNNDSSPKSHKV